jgi:hypothetical protein
MDRGGTTLLDSYTSYIPQQSHSHIDDQELSNDHLNQHNTNKVGKLSIFAPGLSGALECSNPKTIGQVDPDNGEIQHVIRFRFDQNLRRQVPVRCGRNDCYACAIWNGRNIARAIWLSQPNYALTLTDVGNTYELILKRLNKFISRMREFYPTLEYAWMVEPNPRETGNHAHFFIHTLDETIRKSVVERAWTRRVDLKRVRTNSTVPYFGYELKTLAVPELARVYRSLNGVPQKQALVHNSNGFFRDGNGGKVMTRAEAEVLARSRLGD